MNGEPKFKACLVLSIFLLWIAYATAIGRTIYVDDDGPADFSTIQAAINDANDGDMIIVADGTYTGNGNRDIDFLGKAITVRSTDPNDWDVVAATVIDCQASSSNLHRGFYFHSGEDANSALEGLTITNGCEYGGGAIWCRYSGSPTIRNCIIRDNVAPASPGFPWNIAQPGGGILCYESSATIDNCHFLNNTATGNGGAIRSSSGNPLVRNCVFRGNEASSGGAIALYEDSMSIENCVITGNSSTYEFYGGGGIYCGGYGGSTPTISNSTISSNQADGRGGGIYVRDGHTELTNSILWGNNSAEGLEIALRYGDIGPASLTVLYSNVRGGADGVYVDSGCTLNWHPRNIDVDPCFADTANDDYHLKSQAGRWDPNSETWIQDDVTSPCIDGGNPASPIGHEPFPNGGIINMGAYGGMAEASKSYFGEPVCETIIAGDINGDCKVNFLDFRLMAFHWLEDNNP